MFITEANSPRGQIVLILSKVKLTVFVTVATGRQVERHPAGNPPQCVMTSQGQKQNLSLQNHEEVW